MQSVRVIFGGDVMLGRNVAEYIQRYGPSYPLGPVAPLMRSADLTIVNLECAITSSTDWWSGEAKAFYFGAPPQACESLVDAGIDMVSLANNHILDFDFEGLRQTLQHLQRRGILYAGSGENLRDAMAPAKIERKGITFGMVAFCDHQMDFAAEKARPGMAYIDLDDETRALEIFENSLAPLRKDRIDWPILSLHWGPNMVFRPSAAFRRIAHGAIDMGWKMLFGHSAHVFHGVEIYKGYPIIYAAGDLVDDYYVAPDFLNDHQLLLEIQLDSARIRYIRFHPVFIDECQTRPATPAQCGYTVDQMTALCKELGSTVDYSSLNIRGKPH
ncbi:CapA family protein [Oxalobacteraceae bacterium R-40]|uniref:CapA family protein n=1 Tax=Keguizhuia sedimenti TaxID=3064264 RepID=A0ABU1BQE6_9BURK|nr:CapA family protein [Oxalobacteraceae bacterium R-40]